MPSFWLSIHRLATTEGQTSHVVAQDSASHTCDVRSAELFQIRFTSSSAARQVQGSALGSRHSGPVHRCRPEKIWLDASPSLLHSYSFLATPTGREVEHKSCTRTTTRPQYTEKFPHFALTVFLANGLFFLPSSCLPRVWGTEACSLYSSRQAL